MRATIHDVAARAGVSHTTVSWAIHDDPRISAETKAKVRRAIAEVDYHPNYQARGLVSGRSGAIAVVASSFATMFELEVMRGMEEHLLGKGADLNINQYSTLGSSERKSRILEQLIKGRRADAVIGLSLKPDRALVGAFGEAGIPLVLVEEKAEGASSVIGDSEAGARLAVAHLLSRGRRRIGLVVGRTGGEEAGLSPSLRLGGFRAALTEAGLDAGAFPVAYIEGYQVEEGRGALAELLDAEPGLDSVFCAAGDIVALGVLDEARKRGLDVPGKLAIVGYDDLFVSSLVSPALSTLRQPIGLMGSTALSLALEALSDRGFSPLNRVFEPELMVRESS
jgi:LacI family transcriptional regulator